jgi:TonB-linked SusC/RagA family outer membrane protein
MKKLSLLLVLFLAMVGTIIAQRTVTGKVADTKGEPLIGANVLAKGTTAGATTDVDGNYRLSVPAGATTLVVSYTGYSTKELALGASNIVDVVLADDAKVIGEVVVTALGIQRDKKSLGYSATDIKSDEIVQRSESDPIRTLASKVPGVIIQGGGGAPGQSTKMNIRGFSSLTGNTQPLFVVDGIPFDNSVNGTSNTQGTQFSNRAFDLDPNNIEAITVLKGAAASALYGSRAANGVVLVTTKTGKKNRKGLEVTYNSSYSVEKIASLPNYQDVYTQGSNNGYSGSFIGNWGKPFPTEIDRINGQFGYERYDKKYSDAGYSGYADGYSPNQITGSTFGAARFQAVFPELMEDDPNNPGSKRPTPVYVKPYNFLNEFFQTGSLTENSLTFNAGGENTGLSATVSRMDNTGIVPNSKSNRTTISMGGNAKLANGLTINGTVNYTNTNQATPPSAPSYFSDYGGQGDATIFSRLFYLPRNFNLMAYPFENPVTGDNIFYRALDNPLWLVKYSKFTSNVNRAYGNLTASYDVNKWLTLTAKGGVNTYTDASKYYQRNGGVFDNNGRLWNYDVTRTEVDMNYFATIKANITQDLDFRLIAGVNNNQRTRTARFIDGDNLITNKVVNLGATTTQLVRSDDRYIQRFYGAYSDLQLGYKNWLYLGATFRNDWTSTLPKGKNSYSYPSVNMSGVISEAVKLPDFISYAKLRASYAQVGNEADPYQLITTYGLSQPFVTAGGSKINRASLANTLKNADLKNELTKEIEFGTDLRFFKNRIGIDFTWYKRNSFNQITRAALPTSTGFEIGVVNAGEIQNKGIEIGLSLSPIKTENGFNWNMNVNFTKNNSLIVDAGESDIVFGPSDDYVGGTIHRTGSPYGQIFGTTNARDAQGNLQIDRTTGKPIALPTNEIIGDPNAKFIMGLINNFSYKGFTLNVLFDWKQGGAVYSATAASLLLRGQLGFQTDREGSRVVPGTIADPSTYDEATKTYAPILGEDGNAVRNTTAVSAFQYHFSDGFGAYGTASTNVYETTTFRLREVSFGYTFPKKWMQKTPLGNLRLTVSGRNLWFYCPNMLKDLNLDPDVLTETAGSNVQGFEFGAFPTTRRMGINLYATF